MALNLHLKTYTQLVHARKGLFAPNAPDPPKTQDTLSVFPEMEGSKDPFTFAIGYPSSLGSSFLIEIQTYTG